MGAGVTLVLFIWADFIRASLMRRPEFALRVNRYRAVLRSGYGALILALTAGLFSVTAATSGDVDHRDDALLFLFVTVGLSALGLGLLRVWWQLAGRPHHF